MILNENLFLEWVDDSFDWEYVDSKEVKDSDGFMTEYTWYKRLLPSSEERHIFIFGDSDLYDPDDSYADAEFDSYDLAKEWFDNYYGFDYDAEDPDWVEFAEERPADELNETYYAVIEVDGEERKFPFDNRDAARDYIAKAQMGELPEFEGKKIGSTYTEDFKIEEATEEDPMAELARKHNLEILSPMDTEPGSMRIAGTVRDLDNFYREAEELGLLKLEEATKMSREELMDKEGTDDTELINAGRPEEERVELEETLTMHDFDEFKAIADEVGLKTAEDLERFRKEEMQPGESELDAIKRYKQDLIDAGVDLSKLVNEDLANVNESTSIKKFVTSFLNNFSGFEMHTEGSYDYRKGCQDASVIMLDYIIKFLNITGKKFGINLNLKSDILTENLAEGAFKEVAIDIESKEKELADLKDQLDQLKSYDRKECGAGGQFDSTTELDAEISDTETSIEKLEKELEELKVKVNG